MVPNHQPTCHMCFSPQNGAFHPMSSHKFPCFFSWLGLQAEQRPQGLHNTQVLRPEKLSNGLQNVETPQHCFFLTLTFNDPIGDLNQYIGIYTRPGKRLHSYGTSLFYSWVNPLFRLGHFPNNKLLVCQAGYISQLDMENSLGDRINISHSTIDLKSPTTTRNCGWKKKHVLQSNDGLSHGWKYGWIEKGTSFIRSFEHDGLSGNMFLGCTPTNEWQILKRHAPKREETQNINS